MGEVTRIGWTDGTFNGWWGCTKVGPGCDFCYAERDAKRYGYSWGQGALRRFFSEKHWNEPLRWNRKAKEAGKRMKVFCASMADILDNEVEQKHRDRLWALSQECDWIDWQFLTKRIGNAKKMFPREWTRGEFPKNIWLGATVVTQAEADRDVPKLLALNAAIRWLSIEPLIAPVKLKQAWLDLQGKNEFDILPGIDWVIVGGESGVKPRPFELSWMEEIIRACKSCCVAVFVKQDFGPKPGKQGRIPEELWIQEFPK